MSATRELPTLPNNLVDQLVILGWDVSPASLAEFTVMLQGMAPSLMGKYKRLEYPRKLATFPDKEGKMRTVAIFDYWSQRQLRPIHLVLADVLRRIPQDCTDDQSRFVTALRLSDISDREIAELPVLSDEDGLLHGRTFPRFTRAMGLETYYSVDLSNATDRFPIVLQQWVIDALFGCQVGTA